jgi:glycosyltransferase involved in cell wall biosynthesis|tara:strand:+ start:1328 stop:2065 length:738 start_codon:yes stop_codon:yes gene_type:complete
MTELGISIVTGTLNRRHLLWDLIQNTVDSDPRLELILVDGGSTDGTVEAIKALNHPRIKLIEVGKRSSYPHYMGLGIKNASYDYICQWNDDVLLVNDWRDVMNRLDGSGMYIFNWKYGTKEDFNNPEWLAGDQHSQGWFLSNSKKEDGSGDICVNYGIYHKKVYRELGMYDNQFRYYAADGDMAERTWHSKKFKIKTLRHIKVLALSDTPKVAVHFQDDFEIYHRNIQAYKKGIYDFPTVEKLNE